MYIPVFLNSVMLTENCRIVIARAKPEANQKYRMLVCFATLAMTTKSNLLNNSLLMYRIEKKENTITFIRTGSHSDLFE
jgi:mRNA-degrading endonuclease YafQ of YafQ-DinJ toxin-antitoxin module